MFHEKNSQKLKVIISVTYCMSSVNLNKISFEIIKHYKTMSGQNNNFNRKENVNCSFELVCSLLNLLFLSLWVYIVIKLYLPFSTSLFFTSQFSYFTSSFGLFVNFVSLESLVYYFS